LNGITPKEWGLFSRFTLLDPLYSAQTGSPHIGCGSSTPTDGFGGTEAIYYAPTTPGEHMAVSGPSHSHHPIKAWAQPKSP